MFRISFGSAVKKSCFNFSTAHLIVPSARSWTTDAGSSPITTNGGCTTIVNSFDGNRFLISATCRSNSSFLNASSSAGKTTALDFAPATAALEIGRVVPGEAHAAASRIKTNQHVSLQE